MAWKKKEQDPGSEGKPKFLEVEAGMQGDLTFKDPVNLRINGKFEGSLNTKGVLEVGRSAEVSAAITGDDITIAGKVKGNIVASRRIALQKSASVEGDIEAPKVAVQEGAIFQGNCSMKPNAEDITDLLASFNVRELAEYLEVEGSTVKNWASHGKIPAFKEGSEWRFDKSEIEKWVEAGGSALK